nr:hypothetical protein [Tanacetum cinerariifolium]
MMIRKDPPLDQTGGLRDKEKVGSLNQLVLHLNQQPKVQAEEPVQTTCQMDEPSHPVFETGQQYPHTLLQPLPLIPDNRGRRVIPFAYFINNDLKYLWG